MKNIAIVENEVNIIKSIFDLFNMTYANNMLNISCFTSTQDFEKQYKNFSHVFIDLSLSCNSEIDGLTLIERILKIEDHPKIAIITAKTHPEKTLEERNLINIPLFKKPIVLRKDSDKLLSFLDI